MTAITIEGEIAATAAYVGGLLRIEGDIPGALVATRGGLDIRRALLGSSPKDVNLRRDLSANLYQYGDALKANGEIAKAFEAYRESVEVSRALVKENPTDWDLQRFLSVGIERMGTTHFLAKNYAGALVWYRETLDIAYSLANKIVTILEWTQDFTASMELVGDVLHAQGISAAPRQPTVTLSPFGVTLPLATSNNFRRQTNVVLLLVRLAMVEDKPRGRWTEALAIFRPLKSKLD